jgi:hypothetical protein
MDKKKILTLVLLSLVLALVGSIIIVSGMLEEGGGGPLSFLSGDNKKGENSEVLGFKSTTEEEAEEVESMEEPIEDSKDDIFFEEEEPEEEIIIEETETKEELFEPDQPTQAPPASEPVDQLVEQQPVESTLPQAGFWDDTSKFFLMLAPILIIGALLI